MEIPVFRSGGNAGNRQFRLWYPLLLSCAGLLGLAFTRPGIQLAELICGAIIACAALSALSTGRAKLRVSRVLGTGLLQGFTIGSIPTFLDASSSQSVVAVSTDPAAYTYSLALCQIFLGVAILWVLGDLFEPEIRIPELSATAVSRLKLICVLGTVFALATLATGRIGVMGGTIAEGETHESFFADVVLWILPGLAGGTAVLLAKQKRFVDRIVNVALLAAQLLTAVPTGRRNFLYITIVAFMMFCLWQPRFSQSPWKISIALLGSIFVIYVAWTAFLYVRIAGYTLDRSAPLSERIRMAEAIYLSPENSGSLATWADTDVEDRVNIIEFNVQLLTAVAQTPPAHGRGTWEQVKWIIPRAIWPSKEIIDEEGFANNLFGLSLPDSPNSIFSAAIIDFGFFGGFFYPVLISWFLVLTLKLTWKMFPQPVPFICTCAVLYLSLQAEVSLFIYFDELRSCLLFGLILAVVAALPATVRHVERDGFALAR